MANNKNRTRTRTRTRKRSKKTYRKKYRKTASKRMMVGGVGGNPFSTLLSGISGSFSLFRSKAKEEAATAYNDTKIKAEGKLEEAKTKLADTKTAVTKKAECLAACAKM